MINGARVWIRVGGLSFQPAELAKIFLVLFLAGFLRERRELLAQTPTRILGIGLPPLRQLAPLLGMLGAALLLLVAMNDFGTSLLFFGVFVALVYVATGRIAYAVIGLGGLRGRQRHRVHDRAAGGRARVDLARSLEDRAGERLPDRAVALHRRGRRALRRRPRARLHPHRRRAAR